jgi:cell division septation protein DedD
VKLLRTPFTHEELISKTKEVLSVTVPDAPPGCAPEGEETEAPGPSQESTARRESRGEKAGDADRIVVRLKERKEEEKAETKESTVVEPEPSQEPPQEEISGGREDDRVFVARRPARRARSSGIKLTVPLIAAALILILGAAGVIVYKMGLIGGTEVKKPPMVLPLPAVQGRAAQESPAPVQKPEQNAVQERALPPAAVPSSPPAQGPVKKPAGKVVYSVQVGAFKNENNAEALAKHYKEKGYDAFVQTVPKDTEMLHRVLIGKFENRKEAWKLAEEIRDRENAKAVVIGE